MYLSTVIDLETTHHQAYRDLSNGQFDVQRGSGVFIQVARNQCIEQTMNRSPKTSGGIVRLSFRKDAVQKLLVTAHARAVIRDNCFQMVGMEITAVRTEHKEDLKHRISRDYDDNAKVVTFIQNLNRPYKVSNDLCSMTSGIHADDGLTSDLLEANIKGLDAATTFI